MIQRDRSVFDVTVKYNDRRVYFVVLQQVLWSLYYNVTRLVPCLSVGTTRDHTTVGLPVRVGRPCRKTFVLLKVTSESLSLRL